MKNLSKKNWYDDELIWWGKFHKIMNKQWLLDDKLNQSFRAPIDQEKISFLYTKNGFILDLGCGAGHFSHMIHNMGMNVLGIDFSHDQIAKAKNDYVSNAQEKIDFICTNFFEWDYKNYLNNFDAIHVEAFLHHLHDDDLEDFFKIVGEILKPGGKLFLYEPIYHEKFTLNLFQKYILRFFSGILSVIINKIPRLFGLVDSELKNNISKGYNGMSPHERAIPFELLVKLAKKNKLKILSTFPKRYKSIGFFLNIMTLNRCIYKDLLIFISPIIIKLDYLLFKLVNNRRLGSQYDFILYSIKIQK